MMDDYDDTSHLFAPSTGQRKNFFRRNLKAIIGSISAFLIVFIILTLVVVLTRQIGKYDRDVNDIIKYTMSNESLAYKRLGYISDIFGHRISGSQSLNDTINWVADMMKQDGFNVTLEPVNVNYWKRGKEILTLIHPKERNINVIGLGGSIPTPEGGITAEVMVVSSFDELNKRSSEAEGKIVLFNAPWNQSYSNSVIYRSIGAIEAAKHGAVACIIRSVTANSLYTVHTGAMNYNDNITKIPAAAITVEDASYFERIHRSGIKIEMNLVLESELIENVTSYNVIGEIKGSEYPDEIIVTGGHIDSWDVGQGTQDDAGGVIIAWEAVRSLIKMDLKPKRTIRVVGWTNEENGLAGGRTYYENHKHELNRTVAALEADTGVSIPSKFIFAGTDDGFKEAYRYSRLYLEKYLDVEIVRGGPAADISPITSKGVPGFSLSNEAMGPPTFSYFDIHHTHADTFDKINEEELKKSTAAMSVMVYVLSQGEIVIPREYKE